MGENEEEKRQITVDEYDLMMALDHLDNVDPRAQREDWYKNFSRALDLHMKPGLPSRRLEIL